MQPILGLIEAINEHTNPMMSRLLFATAFSSAPPQTVMDGNPVHTGESARFVRHCPGLVFFIGAAEVIISPRN